MLVLPVRVYVRTTPAPLEWIDFSCHFPRSSVLFSSNYIFHMLRPYRCTGNNYNLIEDPIESRRQNTDFRYECTKIIRIQERNIIEICPVVLVLIRLLKLKMLRK